MGEDHVNMALCTKNNKIPPSARNWKHIVYLETFSRWNESAHTVKQTLSKHLCIPYICRSVIEPPSNLHRWGPRKLHRSWLWHHHGIKQRLLPAHAPQRTFSIVTPRLHTAETPIADMVRTTPLHLKAPLASIRSKKRCPRKKGEGRLLVGRVGVTSWCGIEFPPSTI
jgi:hypothetical protein